MDLVQKIKQAGFTPQANSDEDFPPFAGEYRIILDTLAPSLDKTTKEKTAYKAVWKIAERLSGDEAVNRTLTNWYNIAGEKFGENDTKVPVTEEDAGKAIMTMANDLQTCGFSLDLSGTLEQMEADFARAIGIVGYLRAWHFVPKREAAKAASDKSYKPKSIQKHIVKTLVDLRAESKGVDGSVKGAAAPF